MNLLSRLFGAGQSSSRTAPQAVDVQDALRRQTAGALLIDVRQPEEWREGHAPEAKLIPLALISSGLSEIPLDREVLLICRSGNRSRTAQRQFTAALRGCWLRNRSTLNAEPISTHNVTYNAGSHRSRNSPISHGSPQQVVLCKLHTYYLLYLAPLTKSYEFHLYHDI